MKLHSLAVEMMKSARSGETSLDLWRGYCDKIFNMANNLNYSSICSILHSFAYMRYKHNELLSLLSSNLCRSAPFLTANQLTTILKSMSLLQFRNDFLYQILSRYTAKLAPMMNPYQLSVSLYSYALIDSCSFNIFYPIKCAVSSKISQFKPPEMSMLTNALTKIKLYDLELLTIVSSHFCKTISEYDPKSLSLCSNYLLRLNLANSKIIALLISREIMHFKLKFSPQGLALLLNSLSKYNNDRELFQRYSTVVQSRMSEFDIHSCCLIASALSRAQQQHGRLLEQIAERVGKLSSELYPQAVATLTFSLSKLGFLHGPLMYYSGKHLVSYFEDYTLNQICMIIKSYCLLHIDDREVLEFVIISLRNIWSRDSSHKLSMKNATTSGLIWIVECLASFLLINSEIKQAVEMIVKELESRADNMNVQMLDCLIRGMKFYSIESEIIQNALRTQSKEG